MLSLIPVQSTSLVLLEKGARELWAETKRFKLSNWRVEVGGEVAAAIDWAWNETKFANRRGEANVCTLKMMLTVRSKKRTYTHMCICICL